MFYKNEGGSLVFINAGDDDCTAPEATPIEKPLDMYTTATSTDLCTH